MTRKRLPIKKAIKRPNRDKSLGGFSLDPANRLGLVRQILLACKFGWSNIEVAEAYADMQGKSDVSPKDVANTRYQLRLKFMAGEVCYEDCTLEISNEG